jgi:hypothetical protein
MSEPGFEVLKVGIYVFLSVEKLDFLEGRNLLDVIQSLVKRGILEADLEDLLRTKLKLRVYSTYDEKAMLDALQNGYLINSWVHGDIEQGYREDLPN